MASIKIYIGTSKIAYLNRQVATCESADLLSALLSRAVAQEIAHSMTKVWVCTEEDAEIASAWYDASTAHNEGEDWLSIAAKLADECAAANYAA